MDRNDGGPSATPFYPGTDQDDERTDGVVLLDFDDDCKTTAQKVEAGWRIVDWEIHEYDGQPCWFARSYSTIPDSYIEVLAERAKERTP